MTHPPGGRTPGAANGHVADLLPAYLTQTLKADDAALVRAHLAGCAACGTELADWTAIRAATALAFAEPPAAPEVFQRVLAEIDQDARTHAPAPGPRETPPPPPILGEPTTELRSGWPRRSRRTDQAPPGLGAGGAVSTGPGAGGAVSTGPGAPPASPPKRWTGNAAPWFATALLLVVALGGIWAVFVRERSASGPAEVGSAPMAMERGGPARTGVMPGPGPATAPTTVRWRFEADQGALDTAPAVVDGLVYVGTDGGAVSAFDATTGAVVWEGDVGGAASSPTIAGDLVLIGSDDGVLHALDAASGAEQWRVPGLRRTTAPGSAALDGLVVATGDNGELVGLDEATGAERWRADLGAPLVDTPALAAGTAYVGDADGTLHAVDAGSGAERWRFPTGYESVVAPAVAGDLVYLSARTGFGAGQLWAIDAARGEVVWRFPADGEQAVSPAAVAGDLVVVVGADGTVSGVGPDGTARWAIDIPGRAALAAAPTIADGVVYVVTREGELHAIDLASGAERWEIVVGASAVAVGSTVVDGEVFVVDDYGWLQAYGAPS